jgi:hypothetical protein
MDDELRNADFQVRSDEYVFFNRQSLSPKRIRTINPVDDEIAQRGAATTSKFSRIFAGHAHETKAKWVGGEGSIIEARERHLLHAQRTCSIHPFRNSPSNQLRPHKVLAS